MNPSYYGVNATAWGRLSRHHYGPIRTHLHDLPVLHVADIAEDDPINEAGCGIFDSCRAC